MKDLNLLIILISLLIGGSLGYLIKDDSYRQDISQYMPEDMHMMHDGNMMNNNHHGTSMSDMMHNMTANLEGKKGDELDKAFINEMIIHHEGAIEMAEIIVENSNREELIKLGKDIISTQQNEIDLMKEWRTNWFK